MGMRKRVFGMGVFALATVLVSGVALAGRPTGRPTGPATPPPVAYVPPGNPMPDNPSVDERVSRVVASTEPGEMRDRLIEATRLSDLGPGGDKHESARRRGADINGVAVNSDGIVVALSSEDGRGNAQKVVEDEVGRIHDEHGGSSDVSHIRYEVKSLDAVQESTPGGWGAYKSSASFCTITASVYASYLGYVFWYWLTAGHCNKVSPVSSSLDGSFNWASGSSTGASDSGLWYIGTYPPMAASNLIADGWSWKTMSSQSDRGNFDQIGSGVCMTGTVTGTGCGNLVNIWVTPINGVYYVRETNYYGCRPGDSGAPWFGRYWDGTVSLMGIELGGLTNGGCIYSDLGLALNERGVTLYR
jgi:hypothetical protein